MENIKVETPPPATADDKMMPLLAAAGEEGSGSDTQMRRAISSAFKGTAYLASRLPTGIVLAFQLLSPTLSNDGACDAATRTMTAVLVALCGLTCFVLSFTDSYKDGKNGTVYYGFATFSGFYAIDRTVVIPPKECRKRQLGFLDFLQAFLALMAFATVALLDRNIVSCFYPTPSVEIQEVISKLPIANGVVCSILFVIFPTQRHGFDMGSP